MVVRELEIQDIINKTMSSSPQQLSSLEDAMQVFEEGCENGEISPEYAQEEILNLYDRSLE